MSWQERIAEQNRLYDEDAQRIRDAEGERHRENTKKHRESVRRTDRRGAREESRERYEAAYDPRDPESDIRAPEQISGEGFVRHSYQPQTEDERQALARFKVVGG